MSVLTAHRVRTSAARDSAPSVAGPAAWAALAGFVCGFLLALLPVAYVTQVLATQLPLGSTVVHGRTAMVIALVLTTCVGLAFGVGAAARAVSRRR